MYNYLLRMLGDKMTAEDMMQTVFLTFYTKGPEGKSEHSIGAWLFTVARNLVYAHFRSRSSRPDQYNVSDSDSVIVQTDCGVEELFLQQEMKELILQELNVMPPENKEVFVLREYSGLSYREIMTVTGLSEGEVKIRLHRTRKKLIETLRIKLQ